MAGGPAASDKVEEAPECTAASSMAHPDSAAVLQPSGEQEGRDAKEVLVVPKQAMTAALGPRHASEADTEEGDVPMPWWYTPRRLLLLYCFVWGLVYVDQGLLSSNGVTGTRSTDPSNAAVDAGNQGGLQADFNLSYAQLGLLPALYMAGLMVACVIFNELTNSVNSFRLVGIGLAMWALGAVFTGVSFNYGWLLFARIFTGAGEASVMTLTGPFIDDVAPPGSKARWFAWLSLTPTLGVAIGYKLGDLTQYMSWRVLFYIEAGVAVPVVLFCLLAPAVRLRGKLTQVQPEGQHGHQAGRKKESWWRRCSHGTRELWGEVRKLHAQPMYLANNWGFVPVQAAIGVFTFWGPKAAKEILRADDDTVSYLLAGLILGTGVVGTLGGGWVLDLVGSSLRNAMLLQMGASCMALVACLTAFLVSPSLVVFAILLAFGLLGIFLVQAPLYAVAMWTVPVPLRPAGQAFQVICMHAFGDVPLPPIIGVIQGRLNNWRVSMAVTAALLGLSVACYLFGVLYSPWGTDFRTERQADASRPADEEQAKVRSALVEEDRAEGPGDVHGNVQMRSRHGHTEAQKP
ncbi:hypothetical protein CVIRNUC_006668 [Coccomyxa viridis]|uniref:Major facilitator superfamily (MFS) profile domain-containing protein n=1 Tax=Coccomyxa viridis TaxID=1274662 RepID=A0AAV1IBY5_9CHLO|nr:hypothetical protein CVIRNUC_006668 [Coccomyxa viridis]